MSLARNLGFTSVELRQIEGHTGRTRGDDDGRIFELIEVARQRWWETV